MKNSQLYKGSLNTIIMKLLEENGKMYGYEITQRVKAITLGELTITEGALYPALHKLEAEGLLDVEPFDEERVPAFEQPLQHVDPRAHHQLTAPLQRPRDGFNAAAVIGGKVLGPEKSLTPQRHISIKETIECKEDRDL